MHNIVLFIISARCSFVVCRFKCLRAWDGFWLAAVHDQSAVVWYRRSPSCNLCQKSRVCDVFFLRRSCSYFATLVWHTWAEISQGLKQTNISPVPTEWPLEQKSSHALITLLLNVIFIQTPRMLVYWSWLRTHPVFLEGSCSARMSNGVENCRTIPDSS